MESNLSDTQDPPALAEEGSRTTAEQIAEITSAVAELQAARVAEDVAARTTTRRLRPFETVMVVLLAVSLLIHALTLSRLLSVRATLRDEVGRLAEVVQGAKQQQLSYDLPIDQQLPINIDVPIKRSMDVPINTQVRIQQNITLPIDTGLGQINLPIPIDTTAELLGRAKPRKPRVRAARPAAAALGSRPTARAAASKSARKPAARRPKKAATTS